MHNPRAHGSAAGACALYSMQGAKAPGLISHLHSRNKAARHLGRAILQLRSGNFGVLAPCCLASWVALALSL